MPLSKNKIKYIRSLDQKKVRKEEKVFLAEGPKLVGDLLGVFPCRYLAGVREWITQNPVTSAAEIDEVTREELGRASLLKNPQQVLAIFEQPRYVLDPEQISQTLSLVLDDIQDPGNLGTIIRLADWFGIENIICSPSTADVFNPKTVQATMGGIARVKVHYTPLPDFISSFENLPVYGTLLNGENMYTQALSEKGLIVMGNEGNGISPEVEKLITHKLFIPNYPPGQVTTESLNVAIATAVVCAEFRRQAIR